MTTTWRRARRIFEASLDHPSGDRDLFIAHQTAGLPHLGAEVQDLLAAHRQATGWLESPPLAVAVEAFEPLECGTRLGAYRIIAEIGRGGMGVVYRAERADQTFRKEVALKVVLPGAIRPEMVDRLCEERQILALLEHPNIARLLDGGSTPDGLPFLVMEHVQGEPIHRYCEHRQASVEERLALFRQVCSAVHFAHQSLVIHRDLKPSNILVTADGVVKLLDFGLARWTHRQPLRGQESLRQAALPSGLRAMTPEYASPEQVGGDPLTTATDVYSLGVVLYELLTGQRPCHPPQATPPELERAILEDDPIPASRLLARSGEARSRRQARLLARRCRRLAGDLDSILDHTLAKAPRHRYSTVQLLSDDLRRHLAGEPVSVRSSSTRYRLGKFLGRHRALVSLAAVTSLLLVLLLVLLFQQQGRLLRERDQAAMERERAEAVERFTVDLFSRYDLESSGSELARLREEMLDAASRRVDAELIDQPRVRASMMTHLGAEYRRLALYDKALRRLRAAYALRSALAGPESDTLAESQLELGIYWTEQNRYDTARLYLSRSLAGRRGNPGPELADSLQALATLTLREGQRDAAEEMLKSSLAMRRQWLGERHPKVAESLRALAEWTWDEGDLDTTEALWRQALSIFRESLGAHHPAVADGLEDLAVLSSMRGQFEVAEDYHLQALELHRDVYPGDTPGLARILYGLGHLNERRGDHRQAEERYRAALAMNRRLHGDDHLHVAGSLNGVARALQAQGRLQAAEDLIRQALAMNRRLVGPDHGHVAVTQLFLGTLLIDRNSPAAAEDALRQAIDVGRRALGEEHRIVAKARYRLASILLGTPRHGEGRSQARLAVRALEGSVPPAHPDLAEARHWMARANAIEACP
ncbi:MAG: serine/threonine-protein kinase [Acidobacteriota bacterium]